MRLKPDIGSLQNSAPFIFFIYSLFPWITLADSSNKNLPSAWAPTQTLMSQSAQANTMDLQQPLFPPVRPAQSSSVPCFPPQVSSKSNLNTSPIVTPASMPPPTPLVHAPQALPGTPIEFPLLNEAQNPPIGQIHHSNSPATMGASTRAPDWPNAMSTATQLNPTPSPMQKTTMLPIPLQPGPAFTGELQIAHPPTPNEREWVATTGNESAIDNVLAISLLYGGRLASMGFFYRGSDIFYYAIMHKYSGPVFLKPNPYTFSELMRVAKENEELDMGLTQINVSFRIWFPGTKEAEMQKMILENDGYRLTSLCGYSVRNRAQYVGIWTKHSSLPNTPYEAYYGLTLNECLDKDRELKSKGYVAIQFRVFNNANEILCAAIWQHDPRKWHTIEMGENLPQQYKRVLQIQTSTATRTRLPRQISHFIDAEQRVIYVVLWSDLHSFRYPNPPEIWNNKTIPINYLPGTEKLLKPEQLDFIAHRVEHFMRDLDIPGLSVAISRNEKLKYAAAFGYGNIRRKEQVTPMHQFRVGSVSKPITAAAILMLVDQGRLQLDQKVFGPGSFFGNEFQKTKAYGRYITDITIRNLLEHSSGGWNNLDSDPAWLEPRKPTNELISMVLESSPLLFKPGKTWIYSNFGYQILGHIIERISGMTYEEFVKKNLWEKAGVTEVQVARSTLSEKSKREVCYYMSGQKVGFNPYEMLPPGRTGPWGGWIASPIELLKLMSHMDGFGYKSDFLSEKSLKEWVKPTKASNETYGLGWSVNIMGFNGWQHDGRMPGSAAMLVRLDNQLEMAVVVNKEYSERDFFHELGYVLHHLGNCNLWADNSDLFSYT